MGALTAVYSIPTEIIRKTQRSKGILLKIFESQPDWRFDSFDFDKGWETAIRIIGQCYPRTRNRLMASKFKYYAGYEYWTVNPKNVKIVAEDIANAKFESLKKWGLIAPVSDYNGEVVPEEHYSYYIGNIEKLKEFLRKAADHEHYLLFATA